MLLFFEYFIMALPLFRYIDKKLEKIIALDKGRKK
jgi:hypothetical protein